MGPSGTHLIGGTLKLDTYLSNVAGVYNLNNDATALSYAQECYQLGHQEQDAFLAYLGSFRVADICLVQEKYSESLKYAREAESLMLLNGFKDKAEVYALYGWILHKLNETEEAEKYFLKALETKSSDNVSSILRTYLGYADMMMKCDNLKRAIDLLQEGVDYSQFYPTAVSRNFLILKLSECYEKIGNLPKALANFKVYKQETDSLFNLEKERVAYEMRVKYDVERAENKLKEHQLELMEKEKKFHLRSCFEMNKLYISTC